MDEYLWWLHDFTNSFSSYMLNEIAVESNEIFSKIMIIVAVNMYSCNMANGSPWHKARNMEHPVRNELFNSGLLIYLTIIPCEVV